MQNYKLPLLTISPHIRNPDDVKRIMWDVIIALIPAIIASVWFFGFKSLWIILITTVTAVLTEAVIQKLTKKPVTINDGSAIIAGILLGMNVPSGIPLWIPPIGSIFAIGIGKMVFGGLGNNPINPALAGRAFLLASWPVHMTTDWEATKFGFMSNIPALPNIAGIDAFAKATPLKAWQTAIIEFSNPEKAQASKFALDNLLNYDTILKLIWGNISGCIGETSAILIIIGAIYLFLRKVIDWRIPVTYIGFVFLASFIIGNPQEGYFSLKNALFHIFSGGLMLGAFFMATDLVTTPVTKNGRIYFGIGCGILTIIIRYWGGYPEGVCYSILIMNILTPFLDKFTRPKPFGASRIKK